MLHEIYSQSTAKVEDLTLLDTTILFYFNGVPDKIGILCGVGRTVPGQVK